MLLRDLDCVTCGSKSYKVRYAPRLPEAGALNFSARRPNERYHARIVECATCGQIYSSPFLADDLIRDLYLRAHYIEEPQLENMMADYVSEFEAAFGNQSKTTLRVLEIGCGSGFFLRELQVRGYRGLQGIEPSQQAVLRADPNIRDHIRNEFFGPDSFASGSFDVVCCFQVIDHMPDPASFLRWIHDVLASQGRFLTINHNIRSLLSRVLGERCPMYDIEHVYLFDRSTMPRLLQNSDFAVLKCRALRNSYTLDYALKMFPLPALLKRSVKRLLDATGVSKASVRFPGGNMITVAQKIS